MAIGRFTACPSHPECSATRECVLGSQEGRDQASVPTKRDKRPTLIITSQAIEPHDLEKNSCLVKMTPSSQWPSRRSDAHCEHCLKPSQPIPLCPIDKFTTNYSSGLEIEEKTSQNLTEIGFRHKPFLFNTLRL